MSTELATREPMDLLAVAVERGAGVETIERLVALAERVQAARAKTAFEEALIAFQHDCPPIKREADGQAGRAKFKYSSLPDMMTPARPHLKRHGLSVRWKAVSCRDGYIGSECLLTHVGGHCESSGPFVVPISTFAGPSGAQHTGAADTYTERYTFKKVTGIVPDDPDVDASSSAEGVDTETGEVVEESKMRREITGHPGTTCPLCRADAIIKGRAEYGGGWYCFPRKGGCGEKFTDADARLFGTPETPPSEGLR